MITPTLLHFICLAAFLFIIGLVGIYLNRKNLILILVCIELLLLSVNILFVAFARYHGDISGEIFSLFILAVAAAETAIGLSILMVLYRRLRVISVNKLQELKE